MATTAEEELEYESDPEEMKRSLSMRRRKAASDDEEAEREEEDDNAKSKIDRTTMIHSDESDSQGGAAEDYDENDGEEESDYEEEVYEEVEIDEEEVQEANVKRTGESLKEAVVVNGNVDEGLNCNNDNSDVGEEGEEEEKKENEPFAVPTAGAFYMHDDRFRENIAGRNRRTRGGRRLWESRDERKWGHDKFEEMTLQEKHHEEGRRSSRGRYRARSKNRGPDRRQDRDYPRGSGSKAFDKNTQSMAPKAVRGRGPRRYEPMMKNGNQAPPTQNRLSGNHLEKTSQANSGRASTLATNAAIASDPNRKHIFASSLSSASPPFYPSGSSNKDTALTRKKEVQAGSVNINLYPSVTDEKISASQSISLRGKNVLDSLSMAKLYIDDPSMSASVKPLNNVQMLPSGSSLGNASQPFQSRVQSRGVAIPGSKAYHPAPHQNQVNRVSPPTQVNAIQRNPNQGRSQYSVQAGQHTGMSHASSPPKTAMSVSSYESGEAESSETSKPAASKGKGSVQGSGRGSFLYGGAQVMGPTAMSVSSYESGEAESSETSKPTVSKGKGSVQGSGRGSFLYGGAQVMGPTGNMAVSHGDQNFPAFLPLMQFGGQHPGGLPAVGMAFPGYVAQPQNGLGNSEMRWLPVLTSGAGALGQYCPPYIAVDGAYNARTLGQTSSTGSSSKENNSNKSNDELKPPQRSEIVSDEFVQRQNNPNKQPRRYSEMSFSK